MEDFLKSILSESGALGFGWILSIFLLWKKNSEETLIRSIIDANTKALIEFKTLLQERLPRGGE